MVLNRDLYQESIAEILDIADVIVEALGGLHCLKNTLVEGQERNELMRNIHSIKGALGMLGLEAEMEMTHNSETFILSYLSTEIYSASALLLLKDFFQALRDYLNGDDVGVCLEMFNECFLHFDKKSCRDKCSDPCIDHKGPVVEIVKTDKGPPAHVEKPLLKVVVIGKNALFKQLFQDTELEYTQLNCINQVYRKIHLLRETKLIMVDLSSTQVNPFLLQDVLSKLDLPIRCCYLIDEKNEFLEHLESAGNLDFSFVILSKKSLRLKQEIKKLVSMLK
jgi:DNA polymerase III psi subunit